MSKLVTSISLFVFFFAFQNSQAQDSFYGKAYLGTSSAALITKRDFVGGPGYDVERFREFGFLIGKELNPKWALETGVNIATANVIVSSNAGPDLNFTNYKFQMLSFPLLMKYSISSFLYVNGGPMLDIQSSERTSINQSGIGYLIGIGAQHYFNKIGVFVNPHLKRHAAISFDSSNNNLTELGIQLGVSYKF
ncbi:PorT family protein [Belliella sp. DSM 107340]|uniref:PorT family protein n=1 Tax=Belliella calami TaxID=2923436 RepID=A0ABS9UTI4_9BACT|nr:outer membrane beta-barrel protein [Belliella calami]MCH7399720.1 PorT family protein [Belliella calami]